MLKTIDSLDGKTFKEQTVVVIESNDDCATKDTLDLDAEVNLDTMVAYLQWKFPDREHNENKKWVSLLLNDLNSAGIKNCNQIEKIVNDNLKWFNHFEKANPPSNSNDHRFSDIGVIRIILSQKLQLIP